MPGSTIDAILDDGGLPLAEDMRLAATDWLAHLEHERGATGNTLQAYARDLGQCQRAAKCEDSTSDPDREQRQRTGKFVGDSRGRAENARPDRRANQNGDRAP